MFKVIIFKVAHHYRLYLYSLTRAPLPLCRGKITTAGALVQCLPDDIDINLQAQNRSIDKTVSEATQSLFRLYAEARVVGIYECVAV